MSASNDRVIAAYEDKIANLETTKVRLYDQLSYKTAPKQGRLEEMLELSLLFLANSYKVWESGNITLR